MNLSSAADLGHAIRTRRRELRLSQDDVAVSIGVSRKVISELERGKETLQLRIAIDAARTVGLDIEVHVRGTSRA